MYKRVYISADYDQNDGDREVVDILNQWGSDDWHVVNYTDMAAVKSGSVSKNPDCRPCDLKKEFNRQINASSAVIFVIGNKTATRTAGSSCSRMSKDYAQCTCTPYKQNTNGTQYCKVATVYLTGPDDDFGEINAFSYLRHEFEQAKKLGKTIIIVYNSLNNQSDWLPSYMEGYESHAFPFWKKDWWGNRVGNYAAVKKALGYE